MAQNNQKNNQKKNQNVQKKKAFSNPVERPWGKIIIATLAILMCCSGLVSVIYLIVQSIIK